MDHYYTEKTNIPSNPSSFDYEIINTRFKFNTDSGVFSKKFMDFGSYVLIDNVLKDNIKGKTLDLGCGYGPVGIILNKPSIKIIITIYVITVNFLLKTNFLTISI